jgi:hypothetical protein
MASFPLGLSKLFSIGAILRPACKVWRCGFGQNDVAAPTCLAWREEAEAGRVQRMIIARTFPCDGRARGRLHEAEQGSGVSALVE